MRRATPAALGGIPLLNPRWRVSTTTHPILEKALADLRQQYIEQGVALMPAMHPLAVGNLILMPTARDVLAVDLETRASGCGRFAAAATIRWSNF